MPEEDVLLQHSCGINNRTGNRKGKGNNMCSEHLMPILLMIQVNQIVEHLKRKSTKVLMPDMVFSLKKGGDKRDYTSMKRTSEIQDYFHALFFQALVSSRRCVFSCEWSVWLSRDKKLNDKDLVIKTISKNTSLAQEKPSPKTPVAQPGQHAKKKAPQQPKKKKQVSCSQHMLSTTRKKSRLS
ncbi:hypothetical protein LIER_03686 [Lithospermum erythrorhizon]|uniref:Uncharacterized protein n=1 Tax=Lithospermum erythrorhizon TaxID=34254 RepID=A0AAV3NU09_LITER